MRTLEVKRLTLVAALFTTSFALADDVEFTTQVEPILERHCYKCHGDEKEEGGLQLHTAEAIEDSGVVFEGEVDESDIYLRLVLPPDDEEFMPKGADPLPAHEADIVRRWILAGASFGDDVATESEEDSEEDVGVAPAPPEAVAKLAEAGALVMPLAQGDNHLSVGFAGRASELGDADVALIAGVAEQLVWLDLARTKVTDAGLAPLAEIKNLTRLHLENTGISDAALAHLAGLEKLNYLNLYGTQVSDAGLAHLKGLKNLQKLYLWQTKVSYEAAQKLQEAIGGLEVNLGHDHPDVRRAELARRIERAQKTKEAAAAREEAARAEKEAATAQEAAAQKELEAINAQTPGGSQSNPDAGNETTDSP